MKLERTLPPDNDAISVVFSCPTCGSSFAMHTNSMETQLVRSLDIKIGGGDPDRKPMQAVRQSLEGVKGLESAVSSQQSAVSGLDEHSRGQAHDPTQLGPTESESESGSAAGKCPFTGVVEDAYASQNSNDGPVWTESAEARLERVPSFIRSMVRKGIEDAAKQKGYAEITEEVMAEVRSEIGM